MASPALACRGIAARRTRLSDAACTSVTHAGAEGEEASLHGAAADHGAACPRTQERGRGQGEDRSFGERMAPTAVGEQMIMPGKRKSAVAAAKRRKVEARGQYAARAQWREGLRRIWRGDKGGYRWIAAIPEA